MSVRSLPPPVRFDAVLRAVEGTTILLLPEAASRQLPSRGQVAVRGTIDGNPFEAVVEPDGEFGHWLRIDEERRQAARLSSGDEVAIELAVAEEWPEPKLPSDLEAALSAAPDKVRARWQDITPMARWEWVRWVNATRNPDTRRRRVEVSISKLSSGKRRPCCFNLAACTDPELSRNGRLVEGV